MYRKIDKLRQHQTKVEVAGEVKRKNQKKELKDHIWYYRIKLKKNKLTEMWFARYHICAGLKHPQDTKEKNCKDRNCLVLLALLESCSNFCVS